MAGKREIVAHRAGEVRTPGEIRGVYSERRAQVMMAVVKTETEFNPQRVKVLARPGEVYIFDGARITVPDGHLFIYIGLGANKEQMFVQRVNAIMESQGEKPSVATFEG